MADIDDTEDVRGCSCDMADYGTPGHDGEHDNLPRHDADGQPYIAYYRNDEVTGFIWSGRIEDDVQVTREMGEPIVDTFHLTGFFALPVSITEFAAQCDRYLDNRSN